MTVQLLFGTSVAFGFVAWAVVTAVYIWPKMQTRSRIDALRPLLVLHAFRFIGLSFLVPGVVSPNLPLAFAHAHGLDPARSVLIGTGPAHRNLAAALGARYVGLQ